MEKKKKLSLPVQIFIALVLGIVVGLVFYFTGTAGFTTSYIKPFGDIFVNLLKFIVVPVVLLSMIDGIISMGDMKKVGAVGWKTILYFMVTTAVACVIGLVLATVFNNAGLFPNLSEAAQAAEYEAKEYAGFMATLVAIFPTNMWKAFTEANMLQVIVIALLFGGSILAAGEKSKLVRDMVTSAYAVVERLMEFIISLSPIGVFTYMTWVVATQGAEILGSLALVILCAYIGYILHAVLVYSVSAKAFAGISPVKFFKNASAAMIFAFTSTSSAATLPVSKECADALGAEDDISSFVLPLGATINMDGTAIYQCVATVFLATCAGMQLTLGQMITHCGHRYAGLHRHRRYSRRRHDHAGHGAGSHRHPRGLHRPDRGCGPPVRHGPYLPERHRRHCLFPVRHQVGEQEEVNQSTRSTKGKAA